MYACAVASESYNLDMVKRTSLNLDMSLVDEARAVLGTRGTTETVNRALAEVVRQDKLHRLTEMVFDVDNDEIEAWSGPEIESDEPPPPVR
jgi:Arc/MetJ family transcription regulator